MTRHVRLFCDWCGRVLNGDTYIIQGALRFCSEKCWAAWHRNSTEAHKAAHRQAEQDRLDRERMEDEQG